MSTLTCILVCALGLPQGDPNSSGPLAGVPHAITTSSGTFSGSTPMDPTQIYFKEAGPIGTPPTLYSQLTATAPDFKTSKILQGLSSPPHIDAMSIGLDWILSDALGRVAVPSGQWGALSYSVAVTGTGAFDPIKEEYGRPDGAGGDLYAWVLQGSTPLPAVAVDVATRAQDSNEINIFAAGKKGNINAHDVFMSAYALSPAFLSVLPPTPTFYFTVSKATLDKVPSSWWGSSINKSGATILQTTWNSSTRKWPPPSVFLTYAQLSLAQSDDIDALAVDKIRGRILFSTQLKAGRNQLLIALPMAASITVKTYMLSNGTTPVTARLGLLSTDDLDAVCALDPSGGAQARFMPAFLGQLQPRKLLPQLTNNTTAVALRNFNRGNQQDLVDLMLIGWPRPRTPANGQAAAAITPPGQTTPMFVIGFFNRNINPRFAGDPILSRHVVPRNFTLTGLAVEIHWLAADQNGTDMPFPSVLRL